MLVKAVQYECDECGFALWNPIARLKVSTLGLYDDYRFPGRCILALNDHYEQWEVLDRTVMQAFVEDAQQASLAISRVTAALRVNLALLGNTEPHVHFHLIPRQPISEPNPTKSPWNDPRPVGPLSDEAREKLKSAIARELLV
jgi:diadenosine tetraphosphate (Ap4A) HIT family hydrolase